MSIIHLSDSDIQEYLDTKTNKEKVESHILGCEECAILIAEYESFYKELSIDETPQLSVDFVSDTMAAVREETIEVESNKGFYLYSLASLVCAFFLMKYYVGVDFSFLKFELPQINSIFADWSIFGTVAQYYQTSTNTFNMLLFAGFILLFFALVDSVLSRRNFRKISCFSI